MKYEGKLAFVAGGSTGMGRAIAAELAKRGAHVLLIARNRENLQEAKKHVAESAGSGTSKVETLSLDVSDPKQVAEGLAASIQKMGVPDLVINCAGFAYPAYFENIPYDRFRAMLDVNVGGVWNVLQAVVPKMKERGSGHIATISSIVGFMSFVGYSGYSITKFGLCGLFESLRNELKPFGIRAHVLLAPDTDTPGFAEENKSKPNETHVVSGKSKLYSPEEVAAAFMRGIEKKGLYIHIGFGRVIHFLFRHAPWLVRSITDSDYRKARKTAAHGRAGATA
jgi:3-dehydrosphinganine reductase